ncbi:MAG: NAD-dependent epimerase/dehydratase family protein [Chloroflexi bacterium]|nr:NAD-dependent epimerase/dehydratase family protein [Chloroflexota bacterium]
MPHSFLNKSPLPKQLMGNVALVTGATGFIGWHLCQTLVELGVPTFGLCRSASADRLPSGVQPLSADIRDSDRLSQCFREARPTLVWHLAAAGVLDPFLPVEMAIAVNVLGTINVLEACHKYSVRRFIHIGSCYEYSAADPSPLVAPPNPYIASKYAAWLLMRAYTNDYKIDAVALRLFHVYGPRQAVSSLIPAAILSAVRGQVLKMTPGNQKRDFIEVNDVVSALLAAAIALDAGGRTYDIGTGAMRSIGAAVRSIFKIVGGEGSIEMGALNYRPNEVMSSMANTLPAEKELHWKSRVEFEIGIVKTIEWYRKYIQMTDSIPVEQYRDTTP